MSEKTREVLKVAIKARDAALAAQRKAEADRDGADRAIADALGMPDLVSTRKALENYGHGETLPIGYVSGLEAERDAAIAAQRKAEAELDIERDSARNCLADEKDAREHCEARLAKAMKVITDAREARARCVEKGMTHWRFYCEIDDALDAFDAREKDSGTGEAGDAHA